jgi:Amt family ammonium transporter
MSTGLVAITAGCATVETWAAVLIGITAGWVYLGLSKLLVYLRIDDAVDAIPVHMGGGMWGVIATGLFTKGELLLNAFGRDDHVGWFYEWGRGSGDFTLLGAQLILVLFIFGWVGVVMGLYFIFLNTMGWLRIDPLEEEVGMDISRHKGSAYVMDSPSNDHVKKLSDNRREVFEDHSSRRGKRSSSSNDKGKETAVQLEKDEEPASAEVNV